MNRFHIIRIFDFISFCFSRILGANKSRHPEISQIIAFLTTKIPSFQKHKIENYRKFLLNNQQIIYVEDLGAGSRKHSGYSRKVGEIARLASSSGRKGKYLYNLACFQSPDTIVEFGTSIGLGTIYLAESKPGATIYTIEGSSEIQNIALQNFQSMGYTNINSMLGNFDQILPELQNLLKGKLLIFIDGNHTYEATLRYFHFITSICRDKTTIVFDDIRWSAGMLKAWREICAQPGVDFVYDCFTFGIVFKNYKISAK